MNNTAAVRAARVASTIGVVKWILMAVILLAAVVTLLVGLTSGESSTFAIGLGAAVGGILYALLIWVLFGWFEHSLRALSEIVANTAGIRTGVGAQQY
jgi:hypothetical protein